MAERFLYLPAIAFAVCLAALWKWRAGQIAICLVLVAFTARTWVRNRDWKDDRTMAEALVRDAPESYKGHKLLAFETHSVAEAERAIAILDRAAQDDLETLRLAGRLLADNGGYQRSAELLERCWRIVGSRRDAVYPGTAEVLSTLANDYIALGRLDDAAITLMIGQFTIGDLAFRNRLLELYRGVDCALIPGPAGPAIDPKCPTVHRHLCAAMLRTGKTAELAAYGCKN
jgi:hypothetical protein